MSKLKFDDGRILELKLVPVTSKIIEKMPDENNYVRGGFGIGTIIYGDAEKMTVDFTNTWSITLFKAFFAIALPTLFIYATINDILHDKFDPVLTYSFSLPVILVGLFLTVKYLYRPKRIVTFNRLDGNLDVPAPRIKGWNGKKTIKLDFHYLFMPFVGMSSKAMAIAYPNHKFFQVDTGMSGDGGTALSLLFWYMDKNRPLPPGKLFDSYRPADFERRKAEGFPLPICKSMIKTPETTKEQQKERDAVWPKELK